MDDVDSEWQGKGATLSDKTARKDFGLSQDEIVQAIETGKLHYRCNSIERPRQGRLRRAPCPFHPNDTQTSAMSGAR
jgi:hypothetical protein